MNPITNCGHCVTNHTNCETLAKVMDQELRALGQRDVVPSQTNTCSVVLKVSANFQQFINAMITSGEQSRSYYKLVMKAYGELIKDPGAVDDLERDFPYLIVNDKSAFLACCETISKVDTSYKNIFGFPVTQGELLSPNSIPTLITCRLLAPRILQQVHNLSNSKETGITELSSFNDGLRASLKAVFEQQGIEGLIRLFGDDPNKKSIEDYFLPAISKIVQKACRDLIILFKKDFQSVLAESNRRVERLPLFYPQQQVPQVDVPSANQNISRKLSLLLARVAQPRKEIHKDIHAKLKFLPEDIQTGLSQCVGRIVTYWSQVGDLFNYMNKRQATISKSSDRDDVLIFIATSLLADRVLNTIYNFACNNQSTGVQKVDNALENFTDDLRQHLKGIFESEGVEGLRRVFTDVHTSQDIVVKSKFLPLASFILKAEASLLVTILQTSGLDLLVNDEKGDIQKLSLFDSPHYETSKSRSIFFKVAMVAAACLLVIVARSIYVKGWGEFYRLFANRVNRLA